MPDSTREIWKSIPGYDGRYEASDQGRIRSLGHVTIRTDGVLYHTHGQLMRQREGSAGYLNICLRSDDGRRCLLVHRLILEAFVGPCPEGMEACHGNDNPADNRLSNLRWATRSANTYDKIRNGGHPNACKDFCKRGHPFSIENTRVAKDGSRTCRECVKMRRKLSDRAS